MCNCSRDCTRLEGVDRVQMTTCNNRFFSLFDSDVLISILDKDWNSIYEAASSSQFLNSYENMMDDVGRVMKNSESAIRQLNSRWRVEGLVSYHLLCHSSQIFVNLLDENYRILIINKFDGENKADNDPDFGQKLRDICNSVKESISALSNEHA